MENNLEAWCESLLEMQFEVMAFYLPDKLSETDQLPGSDHPQENPSTRRCIFDNSPRQEGYLHVKSSRTYSHEQAY